MAASGYTNFTLMMADAILSLEGNVEDIQPRATIISSSKEKRIVIPNAVLFTNPVVMGHVSPQRDETNPAQDVPQRSEQIYWDALSNR